MSVVQRENRESDGLLKVGLQNNVYCFYFQKHIFIILILVCDLQE